MCTACRLQREHTWETDGEELHQFLEDGLAKHLKVQVGGMERTRNQRLLIVGAVR